jgi:hypothetical protein
VDYGAAGEELLWRRRYRGPAGDWDRATALGVSPDGWEVFVTEESTAAASSRDFLTIAYGSTGATRWTARHNGLGNAWDLATALGLSPDGSKLFVIGSTTGALGSSNYTTIAYSAG